MAITLARRQLYEMLAHAMAEDPGECCGLLAGHSGRVARVYRLRNAEEEPTRRTRYTIDARDQIRAMREMDDEGLDLVGIFHSHPRTASYPSATDLARSHFPGSSEPLYPGVAWRGGGGGADHRRGRLNVGPCAHRCGSPAFCVTLPLSRDGVRGSSGIQGLHRFSRRRCAQISRRSVRVAVLLTAAVSALPHRRPVGRAA
ncbi:MAG: M67 family metallopeptidase [Chloroflexi bacterium]|nr:M67 family metallopeptidase [Chloroflexota bacterium]